MHLKLCTFWPTSSAWCLGETFVKKHGLENRLKALGWWLLREGGNHEVWTNGKETNLVPRHREIKEHLAKSIIRMAEVFRGEKKK